MEVAEGKTARGLSLSPGLTTAAAAAADRGTKMRLLNHDINVKKQFPKLEGHGAGRRPLLLHEVLDKAIRTVFSSLE